MAPPVVYTPPSSTATATIGSAGGMAPPARKLYIFKMVNGDQGWGIPMEFRCINRPGLPIAEVPEFAGTGWTGHGNLLKLPVFLHTELAKIIDELNHGVADGSVGWMFSAAGKYPGTTDGNAYYAAVAEKSGPASGTAATPAATTPSVVHNPADSCFGPKHPVVDCWGNDTTDNGWTNWSNNTITKSVNDRDNNDDEDGGSSCICGCPDCDGYCAEAKDYYDEPDETSWCVCGWGCGGYCAEEGDYGTNSVDDWNNSESVNPTPYNKGDCECGCHVEYGESNEYGEDDSWGYKKSADGFDKWESKSKNSW